MAAARENVPRYNRPTLCSQSRQRPARRSRKIRQLDIVSLLTEDLSKCVGGAAASTLKDQVSEVKDNIDSLIGGLLGGPGKKKELEKETEDLQSNADLTSYRSVKTLGVGNAGRKGKVKIQINEVKDESSDDDSIASGEDGLDLYCRYECDKASEMAHAKMQQLAESSKTHERHETMSEVWQWLQKRSAKAKKDEVKLTHLDLDCCKRGAEFDNAVENMQESLRAHEDALLMPALAFRDKLKGRNKAMKGKVHGKRKGAKNAKRQAMDLEVLAAGIDRYNLKLAELTSELWELMSQQKDQMFNIRFPLEYRLRELGDQNPTTPDDGEGEGHQEELLELFEKEAEKYGPVDVAMEAEKFIEQLGKEKNAIELHEELVRECFIKIQPKNGQQQIFFDIFNDVTSLFAGDTAKILIDVRDQIMDEISPQLTAERDAEFGSLLQRPSSARVHKLQNECNDLEEKIKNVQRACQKFTDGGAGTEIANQVRSLTQGFMPGDTALHKLAENTGLFGKDEDGENSSGSDVSHGSGEEAMETMILTHRRHITQHTESDEETYQEQGVASLSTLREIYDGIRETCSGFAEESRSLHERILNVVLRTDKLDRELAAEDDNANVFQSSIALIEEHRSLFQEATTLATKMEGAESDDTNAQPENRTGAKLLNTEDWFPVFLSSGSECRSLKTRHSRNKLVAALTAEEERLTNVVAESRSAFLTQTRQVISRFEGIPYVAANSVGDGSEVKENMKKADIEIECLRQALDSFRDVSLKTTSTRDSIMDLEDRSRVAQAALAANQPDIGARPLPFTETTPTIRNLVRLQLKIEAECQDLGLLSESAAREKAAWRLELEDFRQKVNQAVGPKISDERAAAAARSADQRVRRGRLKRQEMRNLFALRQNITSLRHFFGTNEDDRGTNNQEST